MPRSGYRARSVPAAGLEIIVTTDPTATTITAAGEIDLLTSVQFKRALDSILDRDDPPALIRADLTRIEFMDTSGVAVLLAARRRAIERGSRLVVTSASPVLQRLFDVTGIGRFLSEHAPDT
jgi:anti-sigma B factor antagonist